MSRVAIQQALRKAHEWYFRLHVNQRLYVNAIVALVIFFISSTIFGVQNSRSLLVLFLLFWSVAICYDLLALYKKVYETIIGKALFVILLSFCTNIAIALSSQVVNSVVGVDPSKFPHTVTLLSILTIPFFVALGLGALYALLLLATPLLLMFHLLPDDNARRILVPGYSPSSPVPYKKTTRIIQLLSVAVFCGFLFSFSQRFSSTYDSFLAKTARSFLYNFEMYPKVPCALSPGSKAAFLSDDKILVGTKDSSGIAFSLRECKSGGA